MSCIQTVKHNCIRPILKRSKKAAALDASLVHKIGSAPDAPLSWLIVLGRHGPAGLLPGLLVGALGDSLIWMLGGEAGVSLLSKHDHLQLLESLRLLC